MFFSSLRAVALVALGLAGAGPACANSVAAASGKSFTIALDGTLGPVLSGSDPAGLDGQSATVKVTVKESLTPYKTTRNSASYHIRAGDVTVDVNGTNYTSTSRSSLIVKLENKADLLTLKAKVTVFGYQVKISDTSTLQAGSWTSDVLQHPALFSPSPQDLTEPASTFTYTISGQTTVLGVTGTASNTE
jgi:hypothetical protein